jgi:hypothetical protein
MSQLIIRILERLEEMFPKQDYHRRLESYIASRSPQSAADVEHFERQFHRNQQRGLICKKSMNSY